jgi:hypothetical protein
MGFWPEQVFATQVAQPPQSAVVAHDIGTMHLFLHAAAASTRQIWPLEQSLLVVHAPLAGAAHLPPRHSAHEPQSAELAQVAAHTFLHGAALSMTQVWPLAQSPFLVQAAETTVHLPDAHLPQPPQSASTAQIDALTTQAFLQVAPTTTEQVLSAPQSASFTHAGGVVVVAQAPLLQVSQAPQSLLALHGGLTEQVLKHMPLLPPGSQNFPEPHSKSV